MFIHRLLNLLTYTLITVEAHSPRHLEPSQSSHLQHARSVCKRDVHCLLTHEAVEGPFYVEHPLIRSNVTEDRPGIPLSLTITVLDVQTCNPVPNVYVDIWQADALGQYSGWASSFLSKHSPPTTYGEPVDDSRWLRGIQPTDDEGLATFHTIWPGWYQGRSTHIHLRIHNGNVTVRRGFFLGAENITHTGQLFFADGLVTEISKTIEPYRSRRIGLIPKMNGDDGIYVESKGGEQIVTVLKHHNSFLGSVTVGIQPNADHNGDRGHRPSWGRHPPGQNKGVLWAILGIAIVGAVLYGIRLYARRRKAAMGYTSAEQDEQDHLRQARTSQSTRYGTI